MTDRFDLEQHILDCWHVVDDIKMLYSAVCDHDPPLSQDQIANVLLGLDTLYQLKFERLFGTYEKVMREFVKPKPL